MFKEQSPAKLPVRFYVLYLLRCKKDIQVTSDLSVTKLRCPSIVSKIFSTDENMM